MGTKKPPRETFAEILANVPEASEAAGQWSYSVPRPWVTVDGQRWTLSGNASYEGKELHHLLRRASLLVFHDYLNERVPVPAEERETFWRRAEALMKESEHSHFVGYLYRATDEGTCLVIYEFC